MANKLALTIIVSIILTILLVSLANVGLNIFFERPDYSDYCSKGRAIPLVKEDRNNDNLCPEDIKTCDNGAVINRDPFQSCEFPLCPEEFEKCQTDYDNAVEKYNQTRFYIFAILGVILLIGGLYSKDFFQFSGLGTGAILVAEGIVFNFENKIAVFVTLLIIIAIFVFAAQKILKKSK